MADRASDTCVSEQMRPAAALVSCRAINQSRLLKEASPRRHVAKYWFLIGLDSSPNFLPYYEFIQEPARQGIWHFKVQRTSQPVIQCLNCEKRSGGTLEARRRTAEGAETNAERRLKSLKQCV